jgi:predicted Holliday junction resolvase-like endonuclease
MGTKVIRQLLSIKGLGMECPNCGEEFPLYRAKPFSMYETLPTAAQKILGDRFDAVEAGTEELREARRQLRDARRRKPGQITVTARASVFGQISEQILPAFVTFPYERTDCRILLKPIDYVVFRGLSRRSRVEAIHFVDVKTGNGRLNQGQKLIRDCVSRGQVKHKVFSR